MREPGEYLDRIEEAGYRITPSRRAVVEAVAAQPGHFTATGLCRAVAERSPGVGRATVFRTLFLLEELGLVERIHSGHGPDGYVACHAGRHHHHLVCRGCGRIREIEACGVEDLLHRLARDEDFAVEGHFIEIHGRCARCRESSGD